MQNNTNTPKQPKGAVPAKTANLTKRKKPNQQRLPPPNPAFALPPPMNAPPSMPKQKRKPKQPQSKKDKQTWYENAIDTVYKVGSKILPLIIGFGDYEVRSNSLLAAGSNGKLGGEVPRLSNTATHNVISHREYLGDILSSTSSFASQIFPINPGLLGSFPWLAALANSYQQYRLRGVIFEFKTLATDYSAQPYIGYVAMGTQYDSLDQPFGSKLEMDNSEYACSKRTNESFLHPIECARDQTALTEMYVRDGPAPTTSSDLRLYDWGQFQIAVGGQAVAGTPIGELWCTYEVEFFKPKLASAVGYDASSLQLILSGVTNSVPLGNGSSTATGNITYVIQSGSAVIFFPGLSTGTWFVQFFWNSTSAVAYVPPSATPFNCTLTGGASNDSGSTSHGNVLYYTMTVTGPSPSITLGTAGTIASGATTCFFKLFQVAALNLSSDIFDHTLCKKIRHDASSKPSDTVLVQSHNAITYKTSLPSLIDETETSDFCESIFDFESACDALSSLSPSDPEFLSIRNKIYFKIFNIPHVCIVDLSTTRKLLNEMSNLDITNHPERCPKYREMRFHLQKLCFYGDEETTASI